MCIRDRGNDSTGLGEGIGPTTQGCDNCCAGQFSAGGAAQCAACAQGKYTSSAKQTSCADMACPAGQGLKAAAGRSPTGQTSATVDCEVCGAGKYSDETDNAACKACGAGKYQDETGKNACKDISCPYGQQYTPLATAATVGHVKPLCSACGSGTKAVTTRRTETGTDDTKFQTGTGAAQCIMDLVISCPTGQEPTTVLSLIHI